MSTLTAIAGDPMDEDRQKQYTQPRDPIIEIRERLDKFQRELSELRHAVANRIMVQPSPPTRLGDAGTLTGLPVSNRRLI